MKFVTVRDLRGRTSALWDDLAERRELIVTNNGKPIAILSATDAESLEASLQALRRCRAAAAVSDIQREAVRSGRDSLTLAEINEEIQAVRKARRAP